MSSPISLGLSQIDRIASLCDFIDHPAIEAAVTQSLPVTMPRDVGSLGFDAPLWVGLGAVGLWSALDAFADRMSIHQSKCGTCRRKCLWQRFNATGKLVGVSSQSLAELEDLRHLFAHNFGGHPDAAYLRRPRHVLSSSSAGMRLSSGATFDGAYVSLNPKHLRHYAEVARNILRACM